MVKPMIPEFEPEVVEAAAKRYSGDKEKVPTTSIDGLVVSGVMLSSRYDKADEYKEMKRMVEAVPTALRQKIQQIWCDSKANACYSVTLDACSKTEAVSIGNFLQSGSRGHNGIWIDGQKGSGLVLDPYWNEP